MVDLLNINPLSELGEWPDTIPQLEDGWYPTGGAVDPANDGGLMNWQAQFLARRTRILKDRVDQLMVKAGSLTTVGPGGDFATLNAALSDLSERRPAYTPGGFLCEIRLLTGYQMAEQVLLTGANLGWLTITSEATEVVIVRGALATQFGSCFPAFGVSDGGTLPRISALFTMDGTGSAVDRNGLYAYNNGQASVSGGGGIKSAGMNGIRLETGGQVSANTSDFSGALANGAYASGGTRLSVMNAVLRNAGEAGIHASNGAVVHADGCVATGCNTFGIRSSRGATVNAFQANARRNGPAGADTTADFSIADGGTIVAISGLGGINVPTASTVSAAGVIYR